MVCLKLPQEDGAVPLPYQGRQHRARDVTLKLHNAREGKYEGKDPAHCSRHKVLHCINLRRQDFFSFQVAEEWALTRAEAARAKAAGDKARQKIAGQLIAGLKREIQQLGETLKAHNLTTVRM